MHVTRLVESKWRLMVWLWRKEQFPPKGIQCVLINTDGHFVCVLPREISVTGTHITSLMKGTTARSPVRVFPYFFWNGSIMVMYFLSLIGFAKNRPPSERETRSRRKKGFSGCVWLYNCGCRLSWGQITAWQGSGPKLQISNDIAM